MTLQANALSTAVAGAAAAWLACVCLVAGQTPADWASLDARAASLYAEGDLARAIEAAQAALRVAVSPAERGKSLDRLGFLHYTSAGAPDRLRQGVSGIRRDG
jgi:hypothetical protein